MPYNEPSPLRENDTVARAIMNAIAGLADKMKGVDDADTVSISIAGCKTTAFALKHFKNKISKLKTGKTIVYNPRIRGKSNSLIFFSSDFEFVVKIIRTCEFSFIIKKIDEFEKYRNAEPDTLLVPYLGIFKLETAIETIHFVVMKNIFDGLYCEMYDLKGKAVKRTNKMGVLTEIDWKQKMMKIPKRNKLIEQIERDSEFLEGLGVMDYSFIVGCKPVNRHDGFRECEGESSKLYELDRQAKPYSFAIVDTLTEYSWYKQAEYLYYWMCCMGNRSVTNPKEYRRRFINLVKGENITDEEE